MGKNKRRKALSYGRPPISKPKEHMTAKRSRTIIRTHHRLQKEHAAAIKNGDLVHAAHVVKSITQNGGLEMYQAASKQGQSKDRGGDSSKLLVEWLRDTNVLQKNRKKTDTERTHEFPLQCLEVGALSADNEISKYPREINMTRIDLNSQGDGIKKQDFMERPLPTSSGDYFDIISLSLVLNYVPDSIGRGEMLKRTAQFLRRAESREQAESAVLPILFLVLPLPCVENSRYLNEPLLLQIMTQLGFSLTKQKKTPKLCYYMFSLNHTSLSVMLPKRKVKDGPGMNNFCIIVE